MIELQIFLRGRGAPGGGGAPNGSLCPGRQKPSLRLCFGVCLMSTINITPFPQIVWSHYIVKRRRLICSRSRVSETELWFWLPRCVPEHAFTAYIIIEHANGSPDTHLKSKYLFRSKKWNWCCIHRCCIHRCCIHRCCIHRCCIGVVSVLYRYCIGTVLVLFLCFCTSL